MPLHLKLRLLVERDTETGRWPAVFPELPACTSAGDTEAEATAHADEALALWIEPSPIPTMPFGPVLSTTYNLTKRECPGLRDEWERSISDGDEQTNRIALLADPGDSELSRAELALLHSVFEKFKDFSGKEMRDYPHTLAEYDDTVGKSSHPISVYPDQAVVLRCAQDIQYKHVVEVLNACRAAKLTNIAFATNRPDKAAAQ